MNGHRKSCATRNRRRNPPVKHTRVRKQKATHRANQVRWRKRLRRPKPRPAQPRRLRRDRRRVRPGHSNGQSGGIWRKCRKPWDRQRWSVNRLTRRKRGETAHGWSNRRREQPGAVHWGVHPHGLLVQGIAAVGDALLLQETWMRHSEVRKTSFGEELKGKGRRKRQEHRQRKGSAVLLVWQAGAQAV